jgi:hypothetical protein
VLYLIAYDFVHIRRPMQTYLDFEIQVGAVNETQAAFTVGGPGGEAGGNLKIPAEDSELRALIARLRRFDIDEAGLTTLGQALFDLLFTGPARDVYTRSRGMLEAEQGLRMRLNIAPAALPLADLPWELLYDPDQGPLALLDMPVIRYLPMQDRLPSMAAPLPLKVLLTAAQTPPAIDVERELNAAAAALGAMGDRVEVTIEPHLTVAKFQKLARSGFHVWHFVGHGGFARDGTTGQLHFEDATGDAEAVSSLQLGIMLNRSGLRLVILDACSTGQLATDPFRSVAPALIRAQIGAVVAMQFRVPEEATAAFSAEFYRALTEGFPLDACVTEGRRAVMNISGLGRPDWAIPVVYTRAQDGRLFDRAAATNVTKPATTVAANTEEQPINAGLDALRSMVETPGPVREAAVSFRTDFQAASEQIEVLSTYKDIHDQLHSLQIHCFNLTVIETRRASSDEIAWDSLSNYELTLQGIVQRLREIAAASAQVAAEVAWANDLATAQQEMAASIDALDQNQLKRASRLMNRVLTIQPAQINARLSAAARALRLPNLVQALSQIHSSLATLELDADKVGQFESAVLAIDRLSESLSSLVTDHDRHQAVDLELRRIETTLETDLSELDLSWLDLKGLALPLYNGISDVWAEAVRSEADKLDTALSAQDPTKIRHFFRRYRRQLGDRFYRVDVDLKRLCDDLRKVGEPLTGVLRVIA